MTLSDDCVDNKEGSVGSDGTRGKLLTLVVDGIGDNSILEGESIADPIDDVDVCERVLSSDETS